MSTLRIDGAMPDADSLSRILREIQAQISELPTVFATLELKIGTTPFVFKEPSPGVLQLGDAGLTYSAGVLSAATFAGINGSVNILADGAIGFVSLSMGDGANSTDRSFTLSTSGNGFVSVDGQGNAVLSGDSSAITIFGSGGSHPGFTECSTSFVPPSDNSTDLGSVTALFGSNRRWRTGYFGTSVISPLVSANSVQALVGGGAALSFPDASTTTLLCGGMVPVGVSIAEGDYVALTAGSFNWTVGSSGGALSPDTDNQANLGDTSLRVKTGYFGTELRSPLFSVASGAGNSGITTTITTGSLVGKTITVQGGIITGFA